jgi:hypothetical protein
MDAKAGGRQGLVYRGTCVAHVRMLPGLLALVVLTCQCARPPPPRFGQVMAEVGRHFQRAGAAAQADDWPMVRYDVEELDELFDDDLPAARPPSGLHVDLQALTHAFAQDAVPALRAASRDRSRLAFQRAFAKAATACNGCHTATGHAFLEIPSQPGAALPTIATATGAP